MAHRLSRRGFFQTLFGGAIAACWPRSPQPTFHGENPFFDYTSPLPPIPMRKMIARVRITPEVMADIREGAFTDFMREDMQGIINDINRREEWFLTQSGRIQ